MMTFDQAMGKVLSGKQVRRNAWPVNHIIRYDEESGMIRYVGSNTNFMLTGAGLAAAALADDWEDIDESPDGGLRLAIALETVDDG